MTRVRPARIEDVPVIHAMLVASAADQGFPGAVVVTEHDLREDGFGAAPRFRVLVAETNTGRPAGMALFYINYSSWVSRLGLYLEDLYVAPEYRGSGAARQLMSELTHIAVAEGCGRMMWAVYRENVRACRFYESCGAHAHDDWLLMSLAGEALKL